jgi:spore maturation protein CgeB
MKILIVASTLDLKYRLGCTPAWWQLLKALYETGHEVIALPYLGDAVESLWWRTYDNPCRWESKAFNNYLEILKKRGSSPSKKTVFTPISKKLIGSYIKPKWEKHLQNIISQEHGIDAVLIMNVPINHLTGIPSKIKEVSGVPVIYYDGDMPTILPKYTVDRGFKFNYYEGADLTEYEAFLTNSKGCIPDLEKMGARNIQPLYYAIDQDLCAPVEVDKDMDISFFGYGNDYREEWMEKLITIPSRKMPEVGFFVGGSNFNMDLGNAKLIGDLSYSEWRRFCCRSKINLNITRWSHTNIYASSTARPFELAAFGCCVVSQPYNGIEEWFDVGKEMVIVKNDDEILATYNHLLGSEDARNKLGTRVRERVLKDHTYRNRADQLINVVKKLGSKQLKL